MTKNKIEEICYNIIKTATNIRADIPSHVGIDGNDRADELAKKALKQIGSIRTKSDTQTLPNISKKKWKRKQKK